VNQLVQKFLEGGLPEPMANALVGGGLPVPPAELIFALAHAVLNETPVAAKALETFLAMPESLVVNAIVGPLKPPDPLGLILIHRREPVLLETALLHESLTAEWVERAVPFLPGSMLEIPLNNQVLWLERPAILDLLEIHPEAEYAIKRRVNEYRMEVLRLVPPEVIKDRLEIIDEVEAGKLHRAWSELPLPVEGPEDEPVEGEHATLEKIWAAVVAETGEEIPLSLTQRVMKLRTNQKIMLAIKGGKEERTLLIREANRLIQVNVIRNGRITEGEVAFIAQMRTINEEVLRIISTNRDWMKKYAIVKNIVMNPKTPLGISLNHMKRLIDMDLKLLVKDKNVAEILRREAKRSLEGKHS
jgi:hypothetical protein